MKRFWVLIIVVCSSMSGLAQDNKQKAGFVLVKVKQQLVKNVEPVERLFIETSSRYSVRKAKLKPGIIPSYQYGTKAWIQSPEQMKLKTLTNYPSGSFQLTEKTLFDQALKNSVMIKEPGETGFSPVMIQEKGDPKRNAEILRKKTKYEAFCLSFPILLFPGEQMNFEYLGVAKAGAQNADVLATSIEDTYQIKLFFDQKTRQLLMMSAMFVDPKTEEPIEHKYFFSDYKEVDGISFAHRIVIQENGEVIEERDVKQVKVNPKLETDFFRTAK